MEENPNASKDLIAATSIPANSCLSYFTSIAMRGQSKLSIKIPKMMVKTMHCRSRRTKRGNQFRKKVVSVFSSVFGNNKSQSKKNEDQSDLSGRSDSQDGKEWPFTAEGNNLVYGNQRIVGPLSQLLKLEVDNTLEPQDAGEGKHRHPVLPLTRFVDQKRNYSGQAARDRTDVVSGWRLLRMKIRSCHLVVRIASRIVTITSSLRKKKVREQVDDDEEEVFLCKKRILMGGKCKPLSSSGALHYDTDGLLIPDVVP